VPQIFDLAGNTICLVLTCMNPYVDRFLVIRIFFGKLQHALILVAHHAVLIVKAEVGAGVVRTL
jgi:hypothetical protein